MSVVSQSSDTSTRSSTPTWKLNDRLASIMDSIYAIGAGLGLRFVVDTVSCHNFKITGTLVGLWEGVILLHFLKKMPRSTDPYVAFGVRLFIDFIVTESVSRLVLVLIWTGMGMVLADVAPAIWEDVGLRRIWRHLRRDLYTISETIPTVVFFPPTRTVRFSPSRESSVTGDEDADADAHTEAPSAVPPFVTTEPDTPASNIIPLSSTAADHVRRRLPGYFPDAFSDTESVLSSAIGRRRLPTTLQNDPTRTSRRRSMYPTQDFDSHSEVSNDLDEMNVSSTTSPKSIETGEPHMDFSRVTDIPDEEEPAVQTLFLQVEESVEAAAEKEEDPIKGDATPRQRYSNFFPLTPTDSHLPSFHQDEPPVLSTEAIPIIPDILEEIAETGESVEDWVQIQKSDAERPPTPPEKDPPRGIRVQPSSAFSATTAHPAASSSAKGDDQQDVAPQPWKKLDTMTAANEGTTSDANIANEQRLSQPPPPPYVDNTQHDYDDIYESEDVQLGPSYASGSSNVDHAIPQQQTEEAQRNLEAAQEAQRNAEKAQKEAERQRKADEDRKKEEELQKQRELQEQKRKEAEVRRQEEAERQKKADDAQRKREEAEAARARMKAEKEERDRKEAADAEIRAKKRADEEAQEKEAERQRLRLEAEEEEAKAKAERLRLEAEEAARVEDEQLEAEALGVERFLRETEEADRLRREADVTRAEVERLRLEFEEQARVEAERWRLEGEAGDDASPTPSQSSGEHRTHHPTSQPQTGEEPLAEQSPLQAEGFHPEVEGTGDEFPALNQTGGENPTQYPEEPMAEQLPEQAESVLSEESEIPEKVKDRLHRMLILKAQMATVETQIANLENQRSSAKGDDAKERIEQDLEANHKVLRKMKNKEQRRWRNETPFSIQPNEGDTAAFINVKGLQKPIEVKKRLQEHLEELLGPDATSLYLTIQYLPTVGKKKNKQKETILEILYRFNLLDYTKHNMNSTTIDVPEDHFAEWLIAYRATITGMGDDGDDG